MKTKIMMLALTLLTSGTVWGEDFPKDSLKVVDMEEVVVIATPKENRKLRELPIAATVLSQENMCANQVHSVKNLTGIVPNLFIPDYGSKLTTSIYIRGIGSRINTPSVGLYVDNIPYIDKSAFDFNYCDIERIDVLRGPQGTLYGRNTMGGLIKVHTKSPFTYQGTDIRMGAATYNNYNVSLTHYHRISERFAFSTGGFYEHTGGFFENAARNNEKVDRSNAGGGRFRGVYIPTSNLKVDINLNYEYSDQGGYPYYYTGIAPSAKEREEPLTEDRADYIGKISYNERSSYRRGLMNAGVNLEYQARNFILSAVTGYQNLNDRMFLDQDFTERAVYTLEQKQKSNTISEEIVFKSKSNKRWQWATGAFGLYQSLNTKGPVTFWEDGVKDVIEGSANTAFAGMPANAPKLHLAINNPTLLVGGDFDTPVWNAAVFHQSTLNDLFVKGLSLTVGVRLDYEKMNMKYKSISDPTDFNFSMKMASRPPIPSVSVEAKNLIANAGYDGKISDDYVQLLPKFALQYEWKKGNNVYATVSKGYRSGGYNVQMFSDLISGDLQNSMINAIKESEQFARFAAMIDKYAKKADVPEVKEATRYKPEYSWNYEVGSHLTLWEGKLWADLSAFYMDMRDQQISQFTGSGLGRTTVNAGKSRSYGAEMSLRASLTNELSLNASYGYTYATFTDYIEYEREDEETLKVRADYNGKYVPFVPKHTLNIGGEYAITCSPRSIFDRVVFQANYNAAGRIYWTELNDVSQSFYGTLNWRTNLEIGDAMISFWARNFLNKDYAAFYFETMNKGFMQKGRPMQFGIDLRCRF